MAHAPCCCRLLLFCCSSLAAAGAGGGPSLRIRTFDWHAGSKARHTVRQIHDTGDVDKYPHGRQRLPRSSQLHSPQPHGAAGASPPSPQRSHLGGRRTDAEDAQKLVQSLWERPEYRAGRFSLNQSEGEHPCFAGFRSMIEDTDRCSGWARPYPPVGSVVAFTNTAAFKVTEFTLRAVVADHINIWLEDNSTGTHADLATKAAMIYANEYDIPELRPSPDSNSWMEHECKVMGQLPFMYTCSDRIQILVQDCGGVENAWVMQGDYLQNFPDPANNQSGPNFDIVFYMCKELLDKNPNPYSAANTFAHELAHVIQGGFGGSFTAMTEGGATWLEGALLNLPPRPMVFAWGFRDWNHILAAHIYASTKEANARKFYQIHAMFLTYLSQDALLGAEGASALQNYQLFDHTMAPWGRMAYDYFLGHVGEGEPATFSPVALNTTDARNAFSNAILDYRVAIVSQCILDVTLRPSEPKYRLPEHLHERPYWDCSSFPAFWSAEGTTAAHPGAEVHYGGAAFFRLAAPENATVSLDVNADPFVRTKVVAAGNSDIGAQVVELSPGESATFGGGAREIFIVQVNVDPAGETLTSEDLPPLWKRSPYRCTERCSSGLAWSTAVGVDGVEHPHEALSGLQTPVLGLPSDRTTLRFWAKWRMEPESYSATVGDCPIRGFDGVQVRVHVQETGEVSVIAPSSTDQGYGLGPDGEQAIYALSRLYPSGGTCANFQGWTGSSGDDFAEYVFDLSPFANRTVRIEVVFASDMAVAGEGFWLTNLSVVARSGAVLADGDGVLSETSYGMGDAPTAGDIGFVGVPVVAGLPEGTQPDRGIAKMAQVRSAPWSARWDAPAPGSVADLRRAYLGWSYSAPTEETETANLHPWQEACVLLQAPFEGRLRTATLFTLVDKIGIGAVVATVRGAESPHVAFGSCASDSPGVEDPGVHVFNLSSAPRFNASSLFLLCVRPVARAPLPADGADMDPFLHLALTNVSSAGIPHSTGATYLLEWSGQSDTEDEAAPTASHLDPWEGHSLTLRAEFVQSLDVPVSPRAADSSSGTSSALRGGARQR